MTLSEAIEHAQKKGSGCDGKCSEDHIQLAAWLRELKRYRELSMYRPFKDKASKGNLSRKERLLVHARRARKPIGLLLILPAVSALVIGVLGALYGLANSLALAFKAHTARVAVIVYLVVGAAALGAYLLDR